jgi:hypothetical protein
MQHNLFRFRDTTTALPDDLPLKHRDPSLSSVLIYSSNSDPTYAGVGDLVTVSLTSPVPLSLPSISVSVAGYPTNVSLGSASTGSHVYRAQVLG